MPPRSNRGYRYRSRTTTSFAGYGPPSWTMSRGYRSTRRCSTSFVRTCADPESGFEHRHPHATRGRHVDGVVVAGVHVPDHAHARVVGEDPLDLLASQRRAIGDGDLAGVDRAAHADTTTVVDRHPGRTTGHVHHGVQQGPVGDRVRSVGHRLRL